MDAEEDVELEVSDAPVTVLLGAGSAVDVAAAVCWVLMEVAELVVDVLVADAALDVLAAEVVALVDVEVALVLVAVLWKWLINLIEMPC